MKKIVLTIILLCCYLSSIYGQDSSRTHKFLINTYPSGLMAGDISLGVEHIYKKRLSHELMLFVKVFNQNQTYYKYNKGFRLNYLMKYNFINRKYFRMSGNISFAYKNIYFHGKEDYWHEQFMSDHGPNKNLTFLMDREINAYGMGVGFSMNFNITRRFSIGTDFLAEFLKTQKSYTVKRSIKGEIPDYYSYYYNISIPTTYVSRYFTTLSFLPTLKVSYHL